MMSSAPDIPPVATASVCLGIILGKALRQMCKLRTREEGREWLQWGILTCWLNDASAYLIGPHMNGPTLPRWVNSRKTWLGYVPGIVLSSFSGRLASKKLRLTKQSGAYLGLCLGIGGALGDILESALKRWAGRADSGSMLPGYGGLLDRLDSALVVMVVLNTWHNRRVEDAP
jgi:phosphatidate cytidylyltransferase